MKVIGINGSPRLVGNTSIALNVVLDELEKEGIETEHIQLYEAPMIPCNACYSCALRRDGRCINETDRLNEYLEKMIKADGIIIASPVYFGNVTAQTKVFMERAGLVARKSGNLLRRKVGAALAIQRKAGALMTFADITNFFLVNQMVVSGSSYWTIGNADRPSQILEDEEALDVFQDQGREMAWLLKSIHS